MSPPALSQVNKPNPDGPDGPNTDAVELTSKCVIELQPGDTVSFQTPGGGGYGPPEERDPNMVLRDVIGGKVNRERAREFYGVVIDEHADLVDEAATLKARTLMSKSRELSN